MKKQVKTELEKEIEESMRAGADWLENELKALYADETLLVSSIDKSYPTLIDEAAQQEHKISRFARTTLELNHTHIWAAPETTKSQLRYVPKEDAMFAEMDNWLRTGCAVMPYRPVRPMEEVKSWDVTSIRTYELALLEKLPQPIVLVNPAVSTLWATEHMKVKILVSNRWEAYVRDEYHKMGKNPDWYNETQDSRLVHFLGTNGKQNCPDKVLWVALTPNPQNLSVYYDDSESIRNDNGWFIRYARQQIWSYEVPDRPYHNRLNPKSTDGYLAHTGQAFFLEGNLKFDQRRDTTLYPGVYFLKGPIPVENNGYQEDDVTVFDVPGGGTWLSRQKAIREYAASINKQPVEMLDSGPIPISMYTEILKTTTEYYYPWGVCTFKVKQRIDDAKTSEAGMGVYVSQNPQHVMVPNCPGLFYLILPIYPGDKQVVHTDSKVYILRSWSEFQNRLPAVVSYFSPYRLHFKNQRELAPAGWDGVADIVQQAAEKRMTVGDAVMQFGATMETIVTWVKYSPAHVLLNPYMSHYENFYQWNVNDNYDYTLRFPAVTLMKHHICRKDELFRPGVYETHDSEMLTQFYLPLRAVGVLMSGSPGDYKRVT